MSCNFTKIFVHLLIIAAVSNFNVYKLIGWDPENVYLFKTNSTNTGKRCEKVRNTGCPKKTLPVFKSLFFDVM